MTYKTILVHVQDDPSSDGRIGLAIGVARLFDATVLGLAAETWYPIAALPEYGYVPGEVIADLERESLQRLERAQARFRTATQGAGVEALVRSEIDFPREALLRHARSADLIVASRLTDHAGGDALTARPGEMLMGAGLPLLLKSDSTDQISAEHVVIGWKNTREARRAITEAMPFLVHARGVTLVEAAQGADSEAAREDLEGVAARLARLGVRVETERTRECAHICEALESAATRRGADLVVLGAYGHSRLRETVFGGVTDGFLQRGAFHTLLSH